MLLELLEHGGRCDGETGDVRAESEGPYTAEPLPAEARLIEESNSVVVLGDRLLLKLYRRLEEGLHPELEMNRALLAKTSFKHLPALLGAWQYRPERGEAVTLGILQEHIVSEGNAWRLTLDAMHRFFDHILAGSAEPPQVEYGSRSLVDLSEKEIPAEAREHLGTYLETARLMARRTAELHVALASVTDDPAFVPEPFTGQYQRSLYQSMRGRIRQTLALLRPAAWTAGRSRCASRHASWSRTRTSSCAWPIASSTA